MGDLLFGAKAISSLQVLHIYKYAQLNKDQMVVILDCLPWSQLVPPVSPGAGLSEQVPTKQFTWMQYLCYFHTNCFLYNTHGIYFLCQLIHPGWPYESCLSLSFSSDDFYAFLDTLCKCCCLHLPCLRCVAPPFAELVRKEQGCVGLRGAPTNSRAATACWLLP